MDTLENGLQSDEKQDLNGQSRIGPRPDKFKLVSFLDVIASGIIRTAMFLIYGIIPKRSIICLYGAPKKGKSFKTLDLAMSIALGWDYRGRKVEQGPVIYCVFEGQTGFQNRMHAYHQEFLQDHKDPVPFFILPVTMDLVKEHKTFITSIQQQEPKPALVILDTLNRSVAGGTEDGAEFTQYIRAADAIRDELQCSVLIVHHSRLDGERPRGSTVLTANVDVQLRVDKDEDVVSLNVECGKDIADGDIIKSKLVVVELGKDEDGNPISSCVLVEYNDGEVERKRDNSAAGTAYEILEDMIQNEGLAGNGNNGVPSGFRFVEIASWKKQCVDSQAFTKARGLKSREKAFHRAREKLTGDKRITVLGPKVITGWINFNVHNVN